MENHSQMIGTQTGFNPRRSQSDPRKPKVETQSRFLGQYNRLEVVASALVGAQGLGQTSRHHLVGRGL